MVQELERVSTRTDFPETAPTANPVFYRTYSRRTPTGSESWQEVCDRTIDGLAKLGQLTPEEVDLLRRMQGELKALPSGRWLWIGGKQWLEAQENFSGAYNCTSTNVIDWRAFGLMMDLAMMGAGTGAVLEPRYIDRLPAIRNRLTVKLVGEIGTTAPENRREITEVVVDASDKVTAQVRIYVGDSRHGWVQSYQSLLELSSDDRFDGEVEVAIDLSDVRPAGEVLKGFGGVANPVKLPQLYERCAAILNKAIGRKLNSVECCLLIDEAATTIVSGNIRRCLPEDALVHTESGLVPIKKVRVGDRVLTSKGFYPVTNFFVQGEQSLCRIQTQDGFFECTADHKVAVLSDVHGNYQMVKAKDLKEGDRLVFVPQAIPGSATELPSLRGENKGNIKSIAIPGLTSDVAYFLGYLHGDGSVAADGLRVRFRVNENSPQILDRLIEVGQQFGLETHTLRSPEQCGTKAYEIQFNSAALNQYLKQFKQPFTSIKVPDCILLGTAAIRQAYLAGLADADGCHSQGVLVASIYPQFLQQVQALYASLGITVRLCGSVRKGTGKWEGELVTVGEKAFDAVEAAFDRYSLQFATQKRDRPKSFKDHGFPKDMVRPLINTYQYRWGGSQKQMMACTLKRYLSNATDLVPITVREVEFDVRSALTYDIEVANIGEFVCEGILVSNSAGMRQGISSDELFSQAKSNLWQQDENGNWRIDPERDALRMANHTRVFHHKPTEAECIEAVQQQYYSGEGAIQYAPEAIARANADIFHTPELKQEFIEIYTSLGLEETRNWLKTNYPEMPDAEVKHRLERYGLNPCVTADTWVHTGDGPRQVSQLIGVQHSTYVNGELFSTTPEGFFCSGTKPVVKLQTKEGYELRLTANHRVLKVTAQTQKKQYSEWVEAGTLQPNDRVVLHNHRDLQPWNGSDTFEEGWLLGSLIGDGSLAATQWNDIGILRFWQESQEQMSQYAISCLGSAVGYSAKNGEAFYNKKLKNRQISSTGLARLANTYGISQGNKVITDLIEQASYDFYRGFLRGIFDADGSVQGSQTKGVSVRLAQSNLSNLKSVQRMLARLGIVSNVYQNRRDAGYRLLPDSQRQPASYWCKAQHELIIANDNLYYFQQLIGFQEPQKADKLATALASYQRRLNRERFSVTITAVLPDGIEPVYDCTVPGPAFFDANGLVAHNCGEIIGRDFHCNLSEIHLNQIDPHNLKEQEEAFSAGALSVATLLNQKFIEPRYQMSRELDPIVGVSFTGLFDFFVKAFGIEWLHWWTAGRPETPEGLEFKRQEREYLTRWREIVRKGVWDYCDRHGLKRPNRYTTVQPSGTKSLLTGASPGWHPPKAVRFIRRITFRKNDPVALACIDYGYNVIPSQSDKDENGNLLNDPFDPRCTEWLVEIPVAVIWADIPGADEIDVSKFSVLAQFDFAMQVQQHYVTHNTSSTWELRSDEVEALGQKIYQAIQNNEGYISAALLARFDDHQSFPRLPFEPISQETYEQLRQEMLQRQKISDFHLALARYKPAESDEVGPAGCDSDKCLFPAQQ
jgi:ribonucleotide reductase class II